MATKTKTKAPSKEVAVRKAGSTGVSVFKNLKEQMKKDAKVGKSTDASDNLIPLVYILQAQSPQALKRNPKYIEGAEAGCLWLRNSADPIVDGDEGFDFQPCYFWKGWIEWRPNREGFVARHDVMPGDAKKKMLKNDKGEPIERLVRSNGNILVESREHVGFILGRGAPMGYVIPMAGSNHTVSRGWMTAINRQVDPDGDEVPTWGKIYRVKTEFVSTDKGDWFKYKISEDARDITTEEEYFRGQALAKAFASGAKQAATDEGVVTESEDDTDL